MRQLRWGILSTAGIARKAMIPAIQAAPNARLLAIASESGKACDVSGQFAIPRAYHSFLALLEDPEIDAVYVPLPNSLHARWVIKAARHGKHVLCEKPAALTAREARSMQAACDQAGVCLMEGYMYRHHPQHTRVREILESGEIGEVRLVRGQFSFLLDTTATNIRLERDSAGGSLHDVGCYPLDVIRRLLGMPDQVSVLGRVPSELGVDVTASGILRYADGRQAEFSSSFEQAMVNRYEVVGTHGTLLVPMAFRPDKQGGVGELVITDEQRRRRSEFVYGDQYPAQVEAFSAWVLGDRPAPDPTAELTDQARLIEACRQSLEAHQPISSPTPVIVRTRPITTPDPTDHPFEEDTP
ncbi:Gfo/Idh/MocA family oxidoreductase [Halomonas sp. ATCH28]|uniref:Gfo/Idh/MocA family oxidoreductase n=1 Tax=Halomonas gemina TaxID=2945105 RepID=A0ABT0T1P1_9GAMM|nr:Gfo/Idh/MocA family oxidoreductase [Halomonas gemina]MCL7940310.1 Gfo/Idh/MocA family oxidoreductase [Halomonas gemina]